jgi:hypothetical protein
MAEEKKLSRSDFEQKIAEKVWEDPEALAELRRDPKGYLEKLVQKSLPASMEIRLVEETGNVMYLRLPPNPENLTDEQLEALEAFGGFIPIAVAIAVVGSVAGSVAGAVVTSKVT